MKVLVTGHHGYIGSVVAPVLAEAGHEVTGVDTFFYAGCDFGAGAAGRDRARDVRDLGVDDLRGYDAIVHLAALSNDPLGELDAELTLDINLRATFGSPGRRARPGVGRFVFASSCSMYGAAAATSRHRGGAAAPVTAYAESKVRAEEGLSALADDDFSPVFLRNATAYGASPRLRLDVVLNNLVGWALTTGKVRILSDGTPWRPIVHIEDIGRAAAAMLEAPREVVHDQPFNVGYAARITRCASWPRSFARPCRVRGRVRRPQRSRPAQLPRRLRQARARAPRADPGVERARGRRGAARRLPAGRAHVRGLRGAALHPTQASAGAAS